MFRRLPTAIFSSLALLLLAGCASGPKAPNPGLKESFHTEIAANGAKRFTYALEMATPMLRGPYTENPSMRGGMVRREDMGRSDSAGRGGEVNVDHGLELKLKETGFCRDGFFVIDRAVSPRGGEIRGECRDAVSRSASENITKTDPSLIRNGYRLVQSPTRPFGREKQKKPKYEGFFRGESTCSINTAYRWSFFPTRYLYSAHLLHCSW